MTRNARRGTPQLLLAVALSAFLALSVFAALASAGSASPAQASSGGICRMGGSDRDSTGKGRSRAGASASRVATASQDGFSLTRFLLEKAVGVNVERYGLQGLGGAMRWIGLGGWAPDSPERRTLENLRAIRAQLEEVEARILGVGARVNQLIDERRQKDLDDEINVLCNIAGEQMFHYRRFADAVESSEALGEILAGPSPALAKVPAPGTDLSPEQIARRDANDFIRHYDNNAPHFDNQINRLRRTLVPGSPLQGTSVLTLFGRVLMSNNRFLTTDHSEAIRALYAELAEIRALASWMGIQYWDLLGNRREVDRVWGELRRDTRAAEVGLPDLIPPGVVIDVGTGARNTANRVPMWLAPTRKDLGWLPRQQVGSDSIAIEEVDDQVRDLNSQGPWGRGWSAPTKQEFEALISAGCSADPDHPAQALKGCRNAVPAGGTIASYLQGINPGNYNWQMIFCQSSRFPRCPEGAGPGGIRQKPHPFIWTSDRHSQRLVCGTRHFKSSYKSVEEDRRYTTYAGFHTLAADARFHEVAPHLPQSAPSRRSATGPENIPYIQEACDSYFRSLVLGGRDRRTLMVEGVLLATRHSGLQDANPFSHFDFMAQRVPGCAGQVATIVGTGGDNRIRGSKGDDVIAAGAGDDVVWGLGGDDAICGGSGEDRLLGGGGKDKVVP